MTAAMHAVENRDTPAPAVAYVLTHHPRVSLTFIAREVDELERLGIRVVPVSLNACGDADVATPAGADERDRTFYVKQAGAVRAVRVLGRLARTSPVGLAKLVVGALRTAGTDVKSMVWQLFYVAEAALVWDHCRQQGARHLHAHFGQTPATIAWRACEIGNMVDGDGWTWSFTIHGFQDFVDERATRLDLKAASAAFVVCVSDFTRSQLMRVSAPEHWSRYQIVRCGIDVEAFAMRDQRPARTVPRVVVVARLSPEKGHVVLLEALRILRDRGTAATLQFIGGGEFSHHVRDEAVRLGVADAVDFAGEIESSAVIPMLRDADLFCLPSFSEGLPVSIMEAMAIGVPVVATYISGIPELAMDGRTALTVPAGNASALADALERLLGDQALQDQLCANARAEVVAHHTSAVNVKQLASLFADAAGWGPSHGRA